jgi:6-phospho-beta-galactosidase
VVPRELISYARLARVSDAKIWVVENGLCNRVRRGRSYLRADGWDRPRYLRENISSVASAVDAGVPMGAYYHWTLADNYEWGTFEPRFGLFGVDRDRGLRWSNLDSMGRDAAGAYRRIIEGLRSGDRSVLVAG